MQNPNNYQGGNDPNNYPMQYPMNYSQIPIPQNPKPTRGKQKRGTTRQPPPTGYAFPIPIPQLQPHQQPPIIPPAIQMSQQSIPKVLLQKSNQHQQQPQNPQQNHISRLIEVIFNRQPPPQNEQEDNYKKKIIELFRTNINNSRVFLQPPLPCIFAKDDQFPIVYFPPTLNKSIRQGIVFDERLYNTDKQDLYLIFSLFTPECVWLSNPSDYKLIINHSTNISLMCIDRKSPVFRIRAACLKIPFTFQFENINQNQDFADFYVVVQMARLLSLDEVKNNIVWSRYKKPSHNPHLFATCSRCKKYTFDFEKEITKLMTSTNKLVCPICQDKPVDMLTILFNDLIPEDRNANSNHIRQTINKREVRNKLLHIWAILDTVHTDWIGDKQNPDIIKEMTQLDKNDIDPNKNLFSFDSLESFVDLRNHLQKAMA